MTVRRSLGLLAFCALAACQPTPEQEAARIRASSDPAKTAIEAQLARFAAGAATGEADSMVAVYAPGAMVMPPNTPAITDRDSLKAAFAATGPFNITFNVQSVWSNGTVATDRGTYAVTMTPPGAPEMTLRGKYLARWEKVNGEWLMTDDIWNDDAPMPPPEPAPARRR